MNIVQGDEMALKRGLEYRGGTFHYRDLLEGTPGRLDNFQLSYGVIGGDFYSPRHRHNFEQIRFQLEGTLDYSRDGRLAEGMVGYFPEGMFYGPQVPVPDSPAVTVVLQCGGASGSGYLSREEARAGMAALSRYGEFKNGVFRRLDGAKGKRNKDGYQAIWEHVNGRALEFPKPRYNHPILIDPEAFVWQSVPGVPGVSEKPLGTFTECRSGVAFVRLDPGARYRAAGRTIHFVVSGTGTVGGQPYRRLTTVFAEPGERAEFQAGETTRLYQLVLPDLAQLEARRRDGTVAVAAE
jgi:hypothetical protein